MEPQRGKKLRVKGAIGAEGWVGEGRMEARMTFSGRLSGWETGNLAARGFAPGRVPPGWRGRRGERWVTYTGRLSGLAGGALSEGGMGDEGERWRWAVGWRDGDGKRGEGGGQRKE